MIEYIGKRVEATGLKDYLKTELAQLTDRLGNEDAACYLRTKLFELQDVRTSSVAATLFFEAQSCAIDYYETLIAILQCAASDRTIPAHMVARIEKPLRVLHRRTADRRLPGIMLGLGIIPEERAVIDPQRAKILELYTAAQYGLVVEQSAYWLVETPDDVAMHVLQLRACLHGALDVPETPGVLSDVKKALAVVIAAESGFYTEALNLLTIADRYYGQAWAGYLGAIVRYELREQEARFPPIWLRDVYVRDPNTTPFSAIATTKSSLGYVDNEEIARAYPRTQSILSAVTKGVFGTSMVNDPRLARYLGIYELSNGDPGAALAYFETLVSRGLGSDRIRCAGSAALACLKLNQFERAVGIVVDSYLANVNAPSLLPIPAVVDKLKEPANWPQSIALPIVFELYATYFNRGQLTHLRYAFERFQQANAIGAPEDLVDRIEEFGKERVVAYLARVWRPEVMRQTVLYSQTREIEDARIRVCGALAGIDPVNAADYMAEIRTRIKKQEIAKATTLVEQSKVYVDIQAIKSALRKKLGDSYARYKKGYQSKDDPLLDSFTELMSELQTKDTPLRQLLSKIHLVSQPPETEADVQFAAIVAEVTNEFLRGEHGLNAYLSTRVRHGALANTLRKPVADERLVTSRHESGVGYVENSLWKSDPVGRSEEWTRIAARLENFAAKFDGVVDHLRDSLLQIKVLHELKDAGENNEALFVYRSSNMERRFFQASDQAFKDIDELVDSCVESLWEKTDFNLKSVQEALEKKVRQKLMSIFDELSDALGPYAHVDGINEVHNAIARAKTATSVQVSLVASWFRRSEVYDRPDYAPEFPIQIAQNMITRTMSTAKGWSGAEIQSDVSEGSRMPGRTLDAMVDIYYVLLENAVRHSGLESQDLSVRIQLSLRDGVYAVRVENNWNDSKRSVEALQRIEEVRASLQMAQSVQRAQLERGSGFHKIWVALKGPSYMDPRLELNVDAHNQFSVEFGCRIAGAEGALLDD
ncbi:hypothetical protein DZC73_12990 [Albitalea terrae]|uniref:Uncharacterized protein n=1 Tax=Piscinibacter terrae TaxID=2496871 RepID=A0A3N7HPT3_9BURK|nr:hypothetical protein DZC73_12990 [Albitalea terrae]